MVKTIVVGWAKHSVPTNVLEAGRAARRWRSCAHPTRSNDSMLHALFEAYMLLIPCMIYLTTGGMFAFLF